MFVEVLIIDYLVCTVVEHFASTAHSDKLWVFGGCGFLTLRFQHVFFDTHSKLVSEHNLLNRV